MAKETRLRSTLNLVGIIRRRNGAKPDPGDGTSDRQSASIPPFTDENIQRTLRLAALEAIPGRIALSISDSFIVPAGILLKATSVQIALLATVPHLIAAFSQLAAPATIKHLGSRTRVLQLCAAFGAIVWVGAMAVPLLPASMRLWALLVFAALAYALFNLPNAAWASWISAMVPVSNRGKYLGIRAMLASAAALVVFLAGGVFLDSLKDRAIWGFVTLFGMAALSRFVSALIYSRVRDPGLGENRIKSHSFIRFLAQLPLNNLGHFLLYSFALNFGVYLSGPFFAVYQLKTLEFSYTIYLGLAVVSSVATMVGLRLWGPLSDRFGNIKVIRIAAVGVSIMPPLWLLVNDPIDALFVQIIGGLSWAGMTLCAVNFIYECSDDENRAQNVAYYYALNGVAIFLGGAAGGFLVGHLPAIMGSAILTLFVLSGFLRLIAAICFLPLVSEVRPKRQDLTTPLGS